MKTIAPDSVLQKALALCRSEYQREIIRGDACILGRDRYGKVKKFKCSWLQARKRLLARLNVNGITTDKIKVGKQWVLVLGV